MTFVYVQVFESVNFRHPIRLISVVACEYLLVFVVIQLKINLTLIAALLVQNIVQCMR